MNSSHPGLAEEQEVFTRVEFESVCKIDLFHQHTHLRFDWHQIQKHENKCQMCRAINYDVWWLGCQERWWSIAMYGWIWKNWTFLVRKLNVTSLPEPSETIFGNKFSSVILQCQFCTGQKMLKKRLYLENAVTEDESGAGDGEVGRLVVRGQNNWVVNLQFILELAFTVIIIIMAKSITITIIIMIIFRPCGLSHQLEGVEAEVGCIPLSRAAGKLGSGSPPLPDFHRD